VDSAVYGYIWLFLSNFGLLQVLSPYYSTIKRRSSSPDLPKYTTYLETSVQMKANEREEMATPEFEAAVLAYLLNTKGQVWRAEQESARVLAKMADAASGDKVAPQPVMEKKKAKVTFSKCTWSADKQARIFAMKSSTNAMERERFKVVALKEQYYAAPSTCANFTDAKAILDADDTYHKTLDEYGGDVEVEVSSVSLAADGSAQPVVVSSLIPHDPMFD